MSTSIRSIDSGVITFLAIWAFCSTGILAADLPVVINEVLASDGHSLADPHGRAGRIDSKTTDASSLDDKNGWRAGAQVGGSPGKGGS